MTHDEARRILESAAAAEVESVVTYHDDGSISCGCPYFSWSANDDTVTLDDEFTADQLEALVVLMRAAKRG